MNKQIRYVHTVNPITGQPCTIRVVVTESDVTLWQVEQIVKSEVAFDQIDTEDMGMVSMPHDSFREVMKAYLLLTGKAVSANKSRAGRTRAGATVYRPPPVTLEIEPSLFDEPDRPGAPSVSGEATIMDMCFKLIEWATKLKGNMPLGELKTRMNREKVIDEITVIAVKRLIEEGKVRYSLNTAHPNYFLEAVPWQGLADEENYAWERAEQDALAAQGIADEEAEAKAKVEWEHDQDEKSRHMDEGHPEHDEREEAP